MVQVALPRFGNGIESVFGGSSFNTVPVMGRLKMSNANIQVIGNQVKNGVRMDNAIAAKAAVEKPSLISVKA